MKTSIFTIALPAALLATACATSTTTGEVASAEREPISRSNAHSKAGFVARYDADGDGKVSREEFFAERKAGYDSRDANGDGKVHEEEYVSEYEVRLKKDLDDRYKGQMDQAHVRFNVLDKDDDEVMTLAEFNASGENIFLNLDTNGDGVIDEQDTAEHF